MTTTDELCVGRGERRHTRRSVVVLGGAALSCALTSCTRPAKTSRKSREALAALIATATHKDVLALAAREIGAGASADDVLAATCLALLQTAGDTGDVHALLVLPSVRALAATSTGLDRWMPVLWAVANAIAWFQRTPPAAPSTDEAPFSRPAFAQALQQADAIGAQRLVRGVLRRAGFEAAVTEVLVEGIRPRNDDHAAIFAAQSVRMAPLLGPRGAEDMLLSAVRYLARSPLRSTGADGSDALDRDISVAMDVLPSGDRLGRLADAAVEARVADDSISGPGVHRTTLLDALLFALARLPRPEQDAALRNAMSWFGARRPRPSAPRRRVLDEASSRVARGEASFRKEHRARLTTHAVGEHDFKHFAAVEAVAEQLGGPARNRWIATLALAHTATASDRWERWDEAASLVRAFPPTA